jgi:hypothetical protein
MKRNAYLRRKAQGGNMITFFRFSLFDYVHIPINDTYGIVEGCKVDVNSIRSYLINGKWWIEGFLKKSRKRWHEHETHSV